MITASQDLPGYAAMTADAANKQAQKYGPDLIQFVLGLFQFALGVMIALAAYIEFEMQYGKVQNSAGSIFVFFVVLLLFGLMNATNKTMARRKARQIAEDAATRTAPKELEIELPKELIDAIRRSSIKIALAWMLLAAFWAYLLDATLLESVTIGAIAGPLVFMANSKYESTRRRAKARRITAPTRG